MMRIFVVLFSLSFITAHKSTNGGFGNAAFPGVGFGSEPSFDSLASPGGMIDNAGIIMDNSVDAAGFGGFDGLTADQGFDNRFTGSVGTGFDKGVGQDVGLNTFGGFGNGFEPQYQMTGGIGGFASYPGLNGAKMTGMSQFPAYNVVGGNGFYPQNQFKSGGFRRHRNRRRMSRRRGY